VREETPEGNATCTGFREQFALYERTTPQILKHLLGVSKEQKRKHILSHILHKKTYLPLTITALYQIKRPYFL